MDVRLLLIPPALLIARWIWKTFLARHPLDNVPGPISPSFAWGHMLTLFSTWPGRQFQTDIVDKYGRVVLLKGPFGARQLYVADPRALQIISVREQDVFEEQAAFTSNNKLSFGEGLLATLADQHRRQRKIINPVFNIKHLRELVPLFSQVSSKLADRIAGEVEGTSGEVDLIVWLSRTALELVGVGGLGYSFNALEGDQHEYVSAIKLFGFSSFVFIPFRPLLPYLEYIGTPQLRRWIFSSIPSKNAKTLLHAVDTMWKYTLEIYDLYSSPRGLELEQKFRNSVAEKNIMTILKQANEAADPKERLSENEMKGQINSLVAAANVTTSRSLCRIVHILSQNLNVQERLRTEILAAREASGGDLNFEQLESLPLMDAVIRETLRLHPPLPSVARTCQKTSVVPLMYPVVGRDGSTITEVTVPGGTDVYIGILPPNTDFATWGPDAREWKPERWLAPLPHTLGDARIPGVFAHQMTFLAGNRGCIGFKFALIEIKVVLSTLLTHFKFTPGKHEIEFVHAGIYQPIINKVLVPAMPVKVEIINRVLESKA